MEKRRLELSSLRSRRTMLEVLALLLILVGSLGPWLWRGYNSYQIFNPETGERELRYELVSKMSPFYVSAAYENQEPTYEWFVSPGTTFAGFLLVISSLVFPLTSSSKARVVSLSTAVASCFFFFLSLGGGLWLGLVTRFTWGFQATIVGLTLMLASVASDLFT